MKIERSKEWWLEKAREEEGMSVSAGVPMPATPLPQPGEGAETGLDLEAIRKRADAATPWEETWRPVPGYEGLYDVSDFGHLRSYLKPGRHLSKIAATPRLMRLHQGPYTSAALTDRSGQSRTAKVHRLVLETFAGPQPDGCEAAHLNGDRSDNRLVNLRWCTHLENEAHKAAHGTRATGELNGASQLTGWQVAEIRFLEGKGVPQAKLRALFDVSAETISTIVAGETWPDAPARTDIPALLAELTTLQQRVGELTEALTYAIGDIEKGAPYTAQDTLRAALSKSPTSDKGGDQ
jgi:hypothetical protein